jgi:hypothetical protein
MATFSIPNFLVAAFLLFNLFLIDNFHQQQSFWVAILFNYQCDWSSNNDLFGDGQ